MSKPYYYFNDHTVYLYNTIEELISPIPDTSKGHRVLKDEKFNILDTVNVPTPSGGVYPVVKVRAENPPRLGWVPRWRVHIGDQEKDNLADGRYNSIL